MCVIPVPGQQRETKQNLRSPSVRYSPSNKTRNQVKSVLYNNRESRNNIVFMLEEDAVPNRALSRTRV